MLAVRLAGASGGEDRVVGPDHIYLKSGHELEIPREDRETALLPNAKKERTTRQFTKLEVESACKIRFEQEDAATALMGPFNQLTVADGAIKYKGAVEKLLAEYDEKSRSWYVYPNHQKYATAVLAGD